MPSEKEKFSARLNETLDDAGFPRIGQGRQSALAKLLGVQPQQAGKWLKGEDFPKTSKLVKIAQFLNVRSNWLLSGVGQKYLSEAEQEAMRESLLNEHRDDSEEDVPQDDALLSGMLSKDAFEVAVAWMKLPVSQRDALKKVIFELSSH